MTLPDWDENTTAEEAAAYLKERHKLQVKLFRKTKANPDPPLAWDSERQAFGGECVDSEVIEKILKMRYMTFFMEVTTSTPDGDIHSLRFEAPRTFFTGERVWEDVEDNFITRAGWRGQQYTYNRPKWQTSSASEGPLYWSVWIREEEFSAPSRSWRSSASVITRKAVRTTIAPYYGEGGFLSMANVINRRGL